MILIYLSDGCLGVTIKYSLPKNMQQIYRRTLTQKCDFNNIALQLYWNHPFAKGLACTFTSCFQNTSVLYTSCFVMAHLGDFNAPIIYLFSRRHCSVYNILYCFFSLHLYLLSNYQRISLLISLEKYLVCCLFDTEWLYFQRSLGLFHYLCSSMFRHKFQPLLIEIAEGMRNPKTI